MRFAEEYVRSVVRIVRATLTMLPFFVGMAAVLTVTLAVLTVTGSVLLAVVATAVALLLLVAGFVTYDATRMGD